MDSLFQSILAWVGENPSWAGLIVFFIAFSESLAIAGMVMPGAALLLGVGALIGLGVLEVWGTLGYAVVGAICGDGVSFWLGYHYRDRLRVMWPFTRYPGLLRKGERFFRRHGGKSIVFGRFIGPLRAIMPATAGMMGMSPRHYLVVNVLSSLVWAPVYIMPGALVAASLGLTTAVAVRLTVLLLLLIFLLWLTQRLVRSVFHYLHPRAQAIIKAILLWGQSHPLLGRLAAALLDPRRPEALGLAVLALLLVAGAGILLLLLKGVSAGVYPAVTDQAVYQVMQGLHSRWADSVMVWVSQLAGAALHLTLFFLLLMWMAWRGRWTMAAHWTAAFAFALLLSVLSRQLLVAPGLTGLEPARAFTAFGDVSVSMALYGFLAVLVARELRLRYRWLPYTAAGMAVSAIAIAQLYLGSAALSALLAGLFVSFIWVVLLGSAYGSHSHDIRQLRILPPLALGLFLAAASFQAILVDEYDVLPQHAVSAPRLLGGDHWRAGGWQGLPIERIDFKGIATEPMTVQWAGALARLKIVLLSQGWQAPEPLTFWSALRWADSEASLAELPLLPRANDGQHEALLLVYRGAQAERQLVLRVWQSDVGIIGGSSVEPATMGRVSPLWLGTLAHQRLTRPLSQFSVLRNEADFAAALAAFKPFVTAFSPQLVRRRQPAAGGGARAAVAWHGEVLLLSRPDEPGQAPGGS